MRKTVRTLGALVIVALVSVGLWQILSDPPHEDEVAHEQQGQYRSQPDQPRQPTAHDDDRSHC